jgi:hypothetical protein
MGSRKPAHHWLSLLLAVVLVVSFGSPAFAEHGDNSSAIRDRDNNSQGWDRNGLTDAGTVACDWGADQLERSEITMAGPGNSGDIHCFDDYYAWDLFGGATCTETNWWNGKCDHYLLQFNLKYYGQITNYWERTQYRYIGCHEFGHTSSVGHRQVDNNDNSCMVSGSGQVAFDNHDLAAINRD